jgi:hypothetical protein
MRRIACGVSTTLAREAFAGAITDLPTGIT